MRIHKGEKQVTDHKIIKLLCGYCVLTCLVFPFDSFLCMNPIHKNESTQNFTSYELTAVSTVWL